MSSTFGNKTVSASRPRWIVPFRSNGTMTCRLFCFPHSGAGASHFASWANLLPPTIQVCGIQLPGREERLKERALTDVRAVIEQITTALHPWQDLPFAFFGHSLGAVLAYELALRLQTEKVPIPAHVFVSARLPPSMTSPLAPIASLPDADFLKELRRRYGGSSAEFWANRELVELFLPILRADLRLAESSAYSSDGCLECPLTAFGGTHDNILPADLHQWQKHTSAAFQLRMVDGDHGFVSSARIQLAEEITRCLMTSPAR